MDGRMRNPGKRYAMAVGKMIIAGITAIIILSAFCYAYNHNGLRIRSESGATDYHWEPVSLISTMKEGFSWIMTDANGYNNAAIPEQIDVLVMGSSHMEAMEVAQDENTSYHLVEAAKEQHVHISILLLSCLYRVSGMEQDGLLLHGEHCMELLAV